MLVIYITGSKETYHILALHLLMTSVFCDHTSYGHPLLPAKTNVIIVERDVIWCNGVCDTYDDGNSISMVMAC